MFLDNVVEFGTLNEKNGVFVGFYLNSKIYEDYDQLPKEKLKEIQTKDFGQILLLMRWDSLMGFPGGFVDEGETLIESAVREVKEEINFDVTPERLVPLISHEIKENMNVHFYTCKISEKERDYIRANAHLAEHFNAEVAGVNFVQCIDVNDGGKGVWKLIESGMLAPSVDAELHALLVKRDIAVHA